MQTRSFVKALGNNETLTATAQMQKIGNQEPYFSITGEIRKGRRVESCGQLRDEITEHFPQLGNLYKWHLVSENSGPMHYEANAVYWAKEGNIENLKSTIVYGAVESDEILDLDELVAWMATGNPNAEAKLRNWLDSRKPQLMQKFHEEIDAFFKGATSEQAA